MECQTCKDNLTAYLDEELTLQEENLLREHLDHCALCSAEFRSLSESYFLVNNALEEGALEVRPEMWSAIEKAILADKSLLDFAGAAEATTGYGPYVGRRRLQPASDYPWKNVVLSLFQTPARAFAAVSIGLVLVVVSLVIFQSKRSDSPSIAELRQQLDVMVQKMDKTEREPHNAVLSPVEDEYRSNPFAVRHVRFERNPFRASEPRSENLVLDPAEGTTGFKSPGLDMREAR